MKTLFPALMLLAVLFSACSDDDEPTPENVDEEITRVTLIFRPNTGGESVQAVWNDPDGEGPESPSIDAISLNPETTYALSIDLYNGIAEEDITVEVEEEADEHLLLFSWTEGLFSSPEGDGNIDSRSDAVNYKDEDANALPLGLETEWTTAASGTGEFRLVLKHQPGIKTSTSGIGEGTSDLDIKFDLTIL